MEATPWCRDGQIALDGVTKLTPLIRLKTIGSGELQPPRKLAHWVHWVLQGWPWYMVKGDVIHTVHHEFFHFQTHTHKSMCSGMCTHTHKHTCLGAQKENLWMFFRFLQEIHGSHKPQISTTNIPCDSEWVIVAKELKLSMAEPRHRLCLCFDVKVNCSAPS